jgi:hypothetical protein
MGTVTIAGQQVSVYQDTAISGVPFGFVDTPTNHLTGAAGAVSFTGWSLAPAGISTVALWREPVGAETGPLIFIGNANLVPGSRPDVANAYPGYPQNNWGWGYQILTNELPNSGGSAGLGNGTYAVHTIATDETGQPATLGITTITVNNAASQVPFGTIDTPAQGGTASGVFVNFGWAVTPNAANIIPADGSTIWVFIDNMPIGHPVYNNYRSDIATLFPGLQNSGGAVGYYFVDTTTLTNGLHSIAWSVKDSAGNAS